MRTRSLRAGFVAALLMFSLPGCGEQGTYIRLSVSYTEAMNVNGLSFTGTDAEGTVLGEDQIGSADTSGSAGAEGVDTLRFRVPDQNQAVRIRVYGSADGLRTAYGEVDVLTSVGEETPATVVLRPIEGAWCVPGQLACDASSNAVVECVLTTRGQLEQERVETCAGTETCSAGACRPREECSNECVDEVTECAGFMNFRRCATTFDADSCTDYGSIESCDEGQTCSAGVCRTECDSQCAMDQTRCVGLFEQVCEDRNGDGCGEWGPPVACRGEAARCGEGGLVQSRAVCANDRCAVETTTRECDCVDGECQSCNADECTNPGPCETEIGATCDEGCTYLPTEGASCTDARACTSEEGVCSADAVCEGSVECVPPSAECVSATRLRTYGSPRCDAAGGCAFSANDVTCGLCAGDLCWDTTFLRSGQPQRTPRMVVLGSVAHVLVWRGTDFDYSSPPSASGEEAGNADGTAKMVISSDGIHVFASTGEQSDVRHFFSADGTTWALETELLDQASSFGVASENGELHFVFSRRSDKHIFHRRCPTWPCTWTTPVEIEANPAAIYDVDASDEQVFALYTQGDNAVVASYGAAEWSTDSTVIPMAVDGDLVANGAGASFMVVDDEGRATRVDYNASTGVEVQPVATTNATGIRLARDGSRFVAAWIDETEPTNVIRIARLDPTETLATLPTTASPTSADLAEFIVGEDGRAHLLYTNERDEVVYATTPSL